MEKMGRFLMRVWWFPVVCLIVAVLSGSGFAAPEGDSVELKVEKGDTLTNVGKKYLADPEKWRVVARVNRMKNPDLIFPGQRVKVPVSLMAGVPVDGKVTFVHGDASARKSETAEWVTLKLGDSVSRGNQVRTGKASAVEVTFGDRNSIFLKSDTTLGITTAEKRGPSYSIGNFYLSVGRVISRLKEATGGDSRMEIRTPAAVASVRGTEFRVSADEQESMRTEVLTGAVNVKAPKKTVRLNRGEGTYVEKGAVPVEPRKLLPPPRPAGFMSQWKELPLRLAFEEAPGLSLVRGVVAKDPGGREVLDEKVVKPKEPMEFVNLPDGTYYLFGLAIDSLGIEGYQSEPYEVKLRANPLPPLIQLKGDDAEFIGNTGRFTWLKVKDAVMYHIQVAEDSGFTRMKEEKKDFQGEAYTTPSLEYGTYYFRISSIAADGYEAGWSETLPFRLVVPPPAPALDKPAVNGKEIFLRWRNLGDGVTYHFQMQKIRNSKKYWLTGSSTSRKLQFPSPTKPVSTMCGRAAWTGKAAKAPFPRPSPLK